ncbi:G5 domain-containing protein [Arcanobacterium haemolyticum]|nr:G5 domain-containing protein [Arcanobacterium haemolyticum]
MAQSARNPRSKFTYAMASIAALSLVASLGVNTQSAFAANGTVNVPMADAAAPTIRDQGITNFDSRLWRTGIRVTFTAASGGFYDVNYAGFGTFEMEETPKGNGTSEYSLYKEGLTTPKRFLPSLMLNYRATNDEDAEETSISVMDNATIYMNVYPKVKPVEPADSRRLTVDEIEQLTDNIIAAYAAAGYAIDRDRNVLVSGDGITVTLYEQTPPRGISGPWTNSLTWAFEPFVKLNGISTPRLDASNRGIYVESISAPAGGSMTMSDGVETRDVAPFGQPANGSQAFVERADFAKGYFEPFAGSTEKKFTLTYTQSDGTKLTRVVDFVQSARPYEKVAQELAANPIYVEKTKADLNADGNIPLSDGDVASLTPSIEAMATRLGIPNVSVVKNGASVLRVSLGTEILPDGTQVQNYYFSPIRYVDETTDKLDFSTVYEADNSLDLGLTEVASEGVAGEKRTTTTYDVEYVNAGLVRPSTTVIASREEVAAAQPKLVKVGTKPILRTEPIPFETEYIDDPELEVGTEEVVTEGVDGILTIGKTFKVDPATGEVIPNPEASAVTAEPVTRVVKRGTKVVEPKVEQSEAPSAEPSVAPSAEPSVAPSAEPSAAPSVEPTVAPSNEAPSVTPSNETPSVPSTGTAAAGAEVSAPASAQATPKRVKSKVLAFTGAGVGVLAGSAVLLLGVGALVLRRRDEA